MVQVFVRCYIAVKKTIVPQDDRSRKVCDKAQIFSLKVLGIQVKPPNHQIRMSRTKCHGLVVLLLPSCPGLVLGFK